MGSPSTMSQGIEIARSALTSKGAVLPNMFSELLHIPRTNSRVQLFLFARLHEIKVDG
jgi:hypothetical protein